MGGVTSEGSSSSFLRFCKEDRRRCFRDMSSFVFMYVKRRKEFCKLKQCKVYENKALSLYVVINPFCLQFILPAEETIIIRKNVNVGKIFIKIYYKN